MTLKVIVCAALMFAIQGAAQAKKHIVCPKYQHVSHSCQSSNPNDACIDVAGHCADDIHVLTEREWRELMAQIDKQKEIIVHVKKLEDLICENNAGILGDCRKGQKVNANGK